MPVPSDSSAIHKLSRVSHRICSAKAEATSQIHRKFQLMQLELKHQPPSSQVLRLLSCELQPLGGLLLLLCRSGNVDCHGCASRSAGRLHCLSRLSEQYLNSLCRTACGTSPQRSRSCNPLRLRGLNPNSCSASSYSSGGTVVVQWRH